MQYMSTSVDTGAEGMLSTIVAGGGERVKSSTLNLTRSIIVEVRHTLFLILAVFAEAEKNIYLT